MDEPGTNRPFHYGLAVRDAIGADGMIGAYFDYQEYQDLMASATREEFPAIAARSHLSSLRIYIDPHDRALEPTCRFCEFESRTVVAGDDPFSRLLRSVPRWIDWVVHGWALRWRSW
jgi:hypothetical protein